MTLNKKVKKFRSKSPYSVSISQLYSKSAIETTPKNHTRESIMQNKVEQ
mgnify:CR=1